jgi:aminoglycoside 6'-N-acetyltransferase I
VVQVRHAKPEDADQWLALRRELWPEEGPGTHFSEPQHGPGSMPEAVLLAVEGDRVVGFAEVSRRAYAEGCETSPVGFLEGWYVVASRRRQGVGRALVQAAEAWARSLGCTEFASDALAENSASAAAHRALGFEEVEIIRCFRKGLETGH